MVYPILSYPRAVARDMPPRGAGGGSLLYHVTLVITGERGDVEEWYARV